MNCLLHFVAVCLFDPSQVYVSGEIDFAPGVHRFDDGMEGRWCRDRWCNGPIGVMRLGVTVDLPSGWTLDYGIKHVSTISTNRDRGSEYPYASLTWRPFR